MIGPRHVITAAHCVELIGGFFTLDDTHVLVGEHRLNVNDGQEKMYLAQTPIFHPKYDLYRSTAYDIAIIVLNKSVNHKYAEIALLPQPYQSFTKLNITGWGSTGKNPETGETAWVSDVLRTVEVDVIMPQDERSEKCKQTPFNSETREWNYGEGFDFRLCICGLNGKDIKRKTCEGDSGGISGILSEFSIHRNNLNIDIKILPFIIFYKL